MSAEVLLTSTVLVLTVTAVTSLMVGFLIGFKKYYTPIHKVISTAWKKDMVLGLIVFHDNIAVLKPVKLDGNYIIDEKGERMWEVKRLSIRKIDPTGKEIIKEGTDKPVYLSMSKTKVPLYILHEDNSTVPNNPSMILIDPDVFVGGIPARRLYMLKNYAELIGIRRERDKIRDAMFYLFILIGTGIAGYLLITAVSTVTKH